MFKGPTGNRTPPSPNCIVVHAPPKKKPFARPNHQLISSSRATWATSTPHTPLYSLRSWKQLCLAYRLAFVIYLALHKTTVQSLVQKKFSQTNLKIKVIPKKNLIHLSRLKLHMAMIFEGRRIEWELGKKRTPWKIENDRELLFKQFPLPEQSKAPMRGSISWHEKIPFCKTFLPTKDVHVHNLFSKEGIHFSGFRQGTSMVRASLDPFPGRFLCFLKYKIKSLWCWEYLCHKRYLFQGHLRAGGGGRKVV